MRWDTSERAGFSDAEPWLPVGTDVATLNVASQRDDPGSMLSLYRRLLDLRREERALNLGEWHDLGSSESAIAYLRSDGTRRFLVAANLTGTAAGLPSLAMGYSGRLLVSTTRLDPEADFRAQDGLAPDEAILVLLD